MTSHDSLTIIRGLSYFRTTRRQILWSFKFIHTHPLIIFKENLHNTTITRNGMHSISTTVYSRLKWPNIITTEKVLIAKLASILIVQKVTLNTCELLQKIIFSAVQLYFSLILNDYWTSNLTPISLMHLAVLPTCAAQLRQCLNETHSRLFLKTLV